MKGDCDSKKPSSPNSPEMTENEKAREGTSREFQLCIENWFFPGERLFLSMKIRKSVTVGSGNGFQMHTANTNCILPHIFSKQRFI